MNAALQRLVRKGHDIGPVIRTLALEGVRVSMVEGLAKEWSEGVPGVERWVVQRNRALDRLDNAVRDFLRVLRDPKIAEVFAKRDDFLELLATLGQLIRDEYGQAVLFAPNTSRGRPPSWGRDLEDSLTRIGIPRAVCRTLIRIMGEHRGLS